MSLQISTTQTPPPTLAVNLPSAAESVFVPPTELSGESSVNSQSKRSFGNIAKTYLHPKKRYKDECKEASESDSTAKLQAVINSATFTKKDAERAQTEKTFLLKKIKDFQDQETQHEKKIADQAAEINRLKDQLLSNGQIPAIPVGAANLNSRSISDFISSQFNGSTHEETLQIKRTSLNSLLNFLEENPKAILKLKNNIESLKQTILEKDAKIKALEDSKNIPDSILESSKERIQLLEDALSQFIALTKTYKF